jgi:hypothetical protein
VNSVMNIQVPQKARDFMTSWVTVSFSRRNLLHGIRYCKDVKKSLSIETLDTISREDIMFRTPSIPNLWLCRHNSTADQTKAQTALFFRVNHSQCKLSYWIRVSTLWKLLTELSAS